MPYKIWMATESSWSNSIDDVTAYTWHCAKMYEQQGHQVTVFFPSLNSETEATNQEAFLYDGSIRLIPYEVKQYYNLEKAESLSYNFTDRLEEIMKAEGIPLVLTGPLRGALLFHALQKRKVNWPYFRDLTILCYLQEPFFLLQKRNQAPLYRFDNYRLGLLEKQCLLDVDGLISPTASLLEMLKVELNCRDELEQKVTLIVPHPFEKRQKKPPSLDKEEAGGEQKEKAVYIGPLQYGYGILEWLKKFKELWDEGFSIALHIVGDKSLFEQKEEPMEEHLRKKYQSYIQKGLLTIEKPFYDQDIAELLQSYHYLLLPPERDSLPYLRLEAIVYNINFLSLDQDLREQLQAQPGNSSSNDYEKNKKMLSLQSYTNVYPLVMKSLQEIEEVRKNITIRTRRKTSLQKDSRELLLTAIMPCGHRINHLEESLVYLQSRFNQKLEIMIAVTKSKAESATRLFENIQGKYDLTVITTEQEDLIRAKKKALENAQGDYVTFLEAGDWPDPEYYQWAVQLLQEQEELSYIGSWYTLFDDFAILQDEQPCPAYEATLPFLLFQNSLLSHALVYRKKDLLHYGSLDPSFYGGSEDYECLINLVKQGCKGLVIPKKLYRYRFRLDEARNDQKVYWYHFYHLLSTKHQELYHKYSREIFCLLKANGRQL
ncbi:glycosyltransferase [Heliorestis acidaminivorans]|uniref:Glycosyltransferase n=1 Tax=Heliorestis acidaminivorans TaxID=553427 RepID=A0A6I0F349_9FIRM|nr:glycosyltransferase [Heliorestis acidaminivorans]KAB2951554.1 glycosyltransferase [Heliorestis acidaminivorans]